MRTTVTIDDDLLAKAEQIPRRRPVSAGVARLNDLHAAEPILIQILEIDPVGCHPLVIEELALGSISKRSEVRDLLPNLRQFPSVEGVQLWTRDKRLKAASADVGVALFDS
jgi:hypothetical protein